MTSFSCGGNEKKGSDIERTEKTKKEVVFDDENNEDSENRCGYEDGSHEATVEYYNPKTGTHSTYTLDVDVENCEIIQINFPKGGWLDDSHISPEELDSYGTATIEDDEGREFEIQIEY